MYCRALVLLATVVLPACSEEATEQRRASGSSSAGAGAATAAGSGGSAVGGAGGAAGAASGGAESGGAGSGGGGGESGGGDAKDIGASLDPDLAALAAVFIGSCIPDDGINRNLRAMYTDVSVGEAVKYYRNQVACLAGKTNGCTAVEECLGILVEKTSVSCPSMCSGDVYSLCEKGLAYTADCSALGLSCVDGLFCSDAPLGPACDPQSFDPKCDLGAPVFCSADGHERRGVLCQEYGLSCQMPGSTGACVGPGPVCTATTSGGLGASLEDGVSCADDELVACVSGGELQVSCETVTKGSTCQTSGNQAFCALGNQCVPPGGDATCMGNSVVVCNAGRLDSIDCTTLGFTGCLGGLCVPTGYYP